MTTFANAEPTWEDTCLPKIEKMDDRFLSISDAGLYASRQQILMRSLCKSESDSQQERESIPSDYARS